MASLAYYLPPETARIFKGLFGVDPAALDTAATVSPQPLQRDISAVVGTPDAFHFNTRFRDIFRPAAFARDETGFLGQQALELAGALQVFNRTAYTLQATALTRQSAIPVLHAAVIAECIHRYRRDVLKIVAAPPAPPAADVPIDLADQLQVRRQQTAIKLRSALGDVVAFDIKFDDDAALEEDFDVAGLARPALEKLGFRLQSSEVRGPGQRNVYRYQHWAAPLKLNMTEQASGRIDYSMGFGLLEMAVTPGTYEDLPLSEAKTATVTLRDNTTIKRRIAMYRPTVAASDLAHRLRQVQAAISSGLFGLMPVSTILSNQPVCNVIVPNGFPINTSINQSTNTLDKLLAVHKIMIERATPTLVHKPVPSVVAKATKAAISKTTDGTGDAPTVADNDAEAGPTSSIPPSIGRRIRDAGVVNVVIAGLRGEALTGLMQTLRGDNRSITAQMADKVGADNRHYLGAPPTYNVNYVRGDNIIDQQTAIPSLLRPDEINIICMGIDQYSAEHAMQFVKRLRAAGNKDIVMGLFQKATENPEIKKAQSAGKHFARTDLPTIMARLFRSGFDRAYSDNEDPVVLRSMMNAVIQSHIRHSDDNDIESFGPIHVCYGESRVRIGDNAATARPIHLTGKEYALIQLLALRAGVLVTKEMFLNHLYGGMDEPELKIIDVFICKARKKLAEAMREDGYDVAETPIQTVWGRGYTWNPNFGKDIARLQPDAVAAHDVPRNLPDSGTPASYK